jgi:two-component system sensor histidine kinase VanS
VTRPRGLSVRLRLALSYAAVVVVTGALLLAVVWLFLLRYVPTSVATQAGFVPGRGDLVDAFAPRAAVGLAGLLMLGLLGGWWLAGRVLAPLARLAEAARRVGEGSLSHRVDLPGRSDELRDLADAFDAMLATVEAQVEAQQRFAADASHELRTPLAVTRALLDVARQDPSRDPALLVERLSTVNERAVDLTEALLLLGRADQRPTAPEVVDLSLLAEEAVETLLPLAATRQVVLEASGDVALTAGSPVLLLQVATNLVHNGIVHNVDVDVDEGDGHEGDGSVVQLAGRQAVVRVRTRVDGDQVELVVENTGEEVPVDLVPTLTQPFRRGAARLHSRDGGTGLGLAVVEKIVRAHGGRLDIDPRPGGGLVVRVRLARAALTSD